MPGYPDATTVKAQRQRLREVDIEVISRALAAAIEIAEAFCNRSFDRVCPVAVSDALSVMVEDRIAGQYSRVPDRATSVITDTGSYSVGQANWGRDRPTGLGDVDATLNAFRIDPPQIG